MPALDLTTSLFAVHTWAETNFLPPAIHIKKKSKWETGKRQVRVLWGFWSVGGGGGCYRFWSRLPLHDAELCSGGWGKGESGWVANTAPSNAFLV